MFLHESVENGCLLNSRFAICLSRKGCAGDVGGPLRSPKGPTEHLQTGRNWRLGCGSMSKTKRDLDRKLTGWLWLW